MKDYTYCKVLLISDLLFKKGLLVEALTVAVQEHDDSDCST